jgi:ApaG protein
MNTLTTSGVTIHVETFYQDDYSNPIMQEYMFAYKIIIANNNNFPVRLLRRSWTIVHADGTKRYVDGEGVVGLQPIITSGGQHQYLSGCNLKTDMGKMFGTYQMENLLTKALFTVNIPIFTMVFPFKNN